MSEWDFLGKGQKFPFRFGDTDGAVVGSDGTPSEHAHIHESIWHILSTRLGERFFLPEFGSRLPDLVFEQNDVVLRALARQYIVDAIKRWEKRVTITNVEFSESDLAVDQNLFLMKITYRIIGSQVEGNFTYPFYRKV